LIAKRGFDFVSSLLGLLILAPLFGLIALWIKLESPGPVFFRQERVGLQGRLFRIHKFRTMRVAVETQGPQITIGADPRITRAGAFLRKHKLDELAQLIDVLSGRMSLVGPRPEVPRYIGCYPGEVRAKVLSVRPGITDWASLHFKEESALLAAAREARVPPAERFVQADRFTQTERLAQAVRQAPPLRRQVEDDLFDDEPLTLDVVRGAPR